ncbi:MAG: nicotinate-nucleotide--dimethylbenzimidazole phosphoribosyltransferase [Thermodesulfobacteriota bacterium]
MSLLDAARVRIAAPDADVARRVQRALDDKTKPRGSLGRLEEIACRVAAMRGDDRPPPPVKAIVVMAADHGVAAEGVSAYPQEVTRQMLRNFVQGGAAINVLARRVGARVVPVDMGVAGEPEALPGVRLHRIAAGTANFAVGPAMRDEEARAALDVGVALARELALDGVTLVGIGEMGIANSTSASALATVLTGAPVDAVTGRGTGVDDAGWRRKVDVVRRAIRCNRPDPANALDVLAKLGGFEIAGLAGVVVGAASERVPVLVDGLIAAAAALVATRLAAGARDYLLASHRSVEPGHAPLLEALGLEPLLDLGLRLGEGTGAALAMGLVDASLHLLHEMASFSAAGVSDTGA